MYQKELLKVVHIEKVELLFPVLWIKVRVSLSSYKQIKVQVQILTWTCYYYIFLACYLKILSVDDII